MKDPMKKFLDKAVKFGALEAKVISPRKVFTAAWVRQKCQFGCGGWAKCLTCPPHSPLPEETRKVLDCYSKAILLHGKGRWNRIRKAAIRLEREIFLAGYYKAYAMGSGPCDLCRTCDLESCKHPEKARPSMEACGIDVFRTARENGYPIRVVKTDKDEPDFFGLVLVE